jgi:hypothetical protein
MTWHRKLPKTLYLNDGRTVATLAQARDVMLALPQLHQTNTHWQDAAALLLQAAYRGRLAPISDAEAQLSQALTVEGMI